LIESYTIETIIAEWWKRGERAKLLYLSAFTRRSYEKRRPRNLGEKRWQTGDLTPILVGKREDQADPSRPGLIALSDILSNVEKALGERLQRTLVTLCDMSVRTGNWVYLKEHDSYIASALNASELEFILNGLKDEHWVNYEPIPREDTNPPTSLLGMWVAQQQNSAPADKRDDYLFKVRVSPKGWKAIEPESAKPEIARSSEPEEGRDAMTFSKHPIYPEKAPIRVSEHQILTSQDDGTYLVAGVGKVEIDPQLMAEAKSLGVPVDYECWEVTQSSERMPLYRATRFIPTATTTQGKTDSPRDHDAAHKALKPRVFVASSVDNLRIADAIHLNLEYDADVTVWDQDIFALSQPPIVSLIAATKNTDFGIFVFSPDDIVTLKKAEYVAVRDNVIFELGLFIGALGSDRNFLVKPRDVKDFHLPTDLIGMTPATYDPNRPDGNITAAVSPACTRIKTAIKKLGRISGSPN
jgi:predicted nucleotide-binding protein